MTPLINLFPLSEFTTPRYLLKIAFNTWKTAQLKKCSGDGNVWNKEFQKFREVIEDICTDLDNCSWNISNEPSTNSNNWKPDIVFVQGKAEHSFKDKEFHDNPKKSENMTTDSSSSDTSDSNNKQRKMIYVQGNSEQDRILISSKANVFYGKGTRPESMNSESSSRTSSAASIRSEDSINERSPSIDSNISDEGNSDIVVLTKKSPEINNSNAEKVLLPHKAPATSTSFTRDLACNEKLNTSNIPLNISKNFEILKIQKPLNTVPTNVTKIQPGSSPPVMIKPVLLPSALPINPLPLKDIQKLNLPSAPLSIDEVKKIEMQSLKNISNSAAPIGKSLIPRKSGTKCDICKINFR